jgi:tRNA(fMet)-specific endonuclease VapC
MSLFVLDTDILTLLQSGHPQVGQRVASHPATELAVTIISVEEQLTGWYTKLRRTKKRDMLAQVYQRMTDTVQFLAKLPILSFTEKAITRYEQLKGQKLNIGKKDLCIAAITLENSGILVTRNTSDFGRVPGLTMGTGRSKARKVELSHDQLCEQLGVHRFSPCPDQPAPPLEGGRPRPARAVVAAAAPGGGRRAQGEGPVGHLPAPVGRPSPH